MAEPHTDTLILIARKATDALRDAAREGRVIDYRQRDPLVMAIHNALDALSAAHIRIMELERTSTAQGMNGPP